MEKYISVADAARTLGVHPQSIYRMLWDEEVPGVIRVGRAIRIPESTLGLFPQYAPPRAPRATRGEAAARLPLSKEEATQ